jgi:hypothetical protein
MAHFFRPSTTRPDGYDIDGRLAPDSVWRVWIPLPGSREIGLYGGRSLWVRSSNEGIVRNDGTGIIRREDPAPDITYLTIRPISAGHCELQAGLGPSIWVTLDVNAGTPRADANLYLASQVGTYDNVDAKAATRNFRNGKPGIELLGGASRGWMRWLEVLPGMAVRETSGPPAMAKPIQASNVWISYSNRPSLLVIRVGWTFKYTDTQEQRYYYLEIWWLPADDREYLVLQSHATHAEHGNPIGFGIVMRPWCGDAAIANEMINELAASLIALVAGLVGAGLWRASIRSQRPLTAGGAGMNAVFGEGTLTEAELAELQAIAKKYGAELDVVGSRARGTGRNIDKLNLPVGKGDNTRSDIDVVIDGQKDIDSGGRLSHDIANASNGAGKVSSSMGMPWNPPYIKITPNQPPLHVK